MKLVKMIRNQIIVTTLVCVAGYVAYQVLLDDKAKEGLASLVGTVQDSYGTLSTLVNERIGTIMDDEVVAQNRAQIRDKWADLGF